MKAEDAVRRATTVASSLKGEDAVAVHVLVELARRVIRTRQAIRDLAEAVAPETHLNQQDLFGGDR